MEPSTTLLAAVAAIGGVAAVRRWWSGPLVRADSRKEAWQAVYPGDRVHASVVSEDGRVALVETDWGCGVICRKGAFARRLDGASTDIDESGLRIRFDDITAPRIDVRLDRDKAALWHEKIAET